MLRAVQFLDPSPSDMRGYAFKDEDTLQLHGQNLSAVLYSLVDQGQMPAILEFVGDLSERPIRELTFLQTPRSEVMVQNVETFGGVVREVPAALMSDGTLRVLAIAAALLSAPQGTLVVIEEIDNGVHPSRAERLLHSIRAVAARRKLRVLITTHNPALQDALPDDLLGDVTLAHRDAESGETVLSRLADLDAFPQVAAAGPLGRLVTTKRFERLVKSTGERPPLPAWLAGDGGVAH